MPPLNPLQARLAEIPVEIRDHTLLGSATRVWEFGPAHADHTVVLVHGFRGTHHGLANLIALMPDVKFIAPDLPGFGESTPLGREHSIDGYAEWLLALLEIVDASGNATVLGHSFGSMIVASAAAKLNGRDVILVNPIAENALAGPERLLTNLGIFYYWAGAKLPKLVGQKLLSSGLITRVMSEAMTVSKDRSLRMWIHAEHDAHFSDFANRDVLLEAFQASVSTDVTTYASTLPAKTTLIVGEKDIIAPLDAALRLFEQLPQASMQVIQGVGHLIHYETPKPLARLVRAHLDEVGTKDGK